MKNVLLMSVLCLSCIAQAQKDSTKKVLVEQVKDSLTFEKKIGLEIYGSLFLGGNLELPFSDAFPVSQDSHAKDTAMLLIAPSLNIQTNWTIHHFQYDGGTHALVFINGVFLNEKSSVYLIVAKNITSSENAMGIGYERFFKFNDWFEFAPFIELLNYSSVGEGFFKSNQTYSISIGGVLNFRTRALKLCP